MKPLVIGLAALTISGCVAFIRIYSIEEINDFKSRSYQNISKEQFFDVAEKLFTLSDANDYAFLRKNNQLDATRVWYHYNITSRTTGTDLWNIKVVENNQTNQINVFTDVKFTISHGSLSSEHMHKNKGLYDLFYSRIDYLLDKSDDWVTCTAIETGEHAEFKTIRVEGFDRFLEPLCDRFTVIDKLPDAAQ